MKYSLCICFIKKVFSKNNTGTALKYIAFVFLFSLFLATKVAALEYISAPKIYTGEINDSGYKYTVKLFLPTPQVFVLQEKTILPSGKKDIQTITGRWHQIRDGYILQMTNAHGYYRRLNVGAKDNLYLSCTLPSGKQYTCVLRISSFNEPISIDMTGIINFTGDKAYFIDCNTRLKYIFKGQYSNALLTESYGNVKQLCIVTVKSIIDINNIAEDRIAITSIKNIKKYINQNLSISNSFFIDNLSQYYWIVKDNTGNFFKSKYVLHFVFEKSLNDGAFSLSSINGTILGRFKLDKQFINFSANSNIKNNIITKLKTISSWYSWGDILELWSDNECVLMLEKYTLHQVLRTKI